MKKQFVPYEIAIALKVLGFNEKCYGYYTEHKEYFYFDVDDLSSAYTKNMDNLLKNSVDDMECTAPLWQQAFGFFREEHGLHAEPVWDNDNGTYWFFCITTIGNIMEDEGGFKIDLDWVDSYEEAQINCLNKLIEIIKENG